MTSASPHPTFSSHEGSHFCCEGINIQEISVLLQLLFKQKIES
jgi:hypothetical protein